MPTRKGRHRPTRIDVNFTGVLVTSDGHEIKVEVRDISANGFRVRLNDEVRIGELVILRVGPRSAFRAQIKWTLGDEAGGLFLNSWSGVESGDSR